MSRLLPASSSSAVIARTAASKLPDIFCEAGIIRHVLSFLLCVDKKGNWSERIQLARDCASFRSVSTTWHDVTWEMMSATAPADAIVIMSLSRLAKIKAGVAALDLSSIHDEFIRAIRAKWNTFEGHWDWESFEPTAMECIETIINHFGGTADRFAALVSREYKRLLVIKAVEQQAIILSSDINKKQQQQQQPAMTNHIPIMWTEMCQPNQLVDEFWRSHMLSPRKYAADCMRVFGEIMDYDGSYTSPNEHTGSDYQNKRNILFKFELENFPERDYFWGRLGLKGTGRALLFGNDFNVGNVAGTTCYYG